MSTITGAQRYVDEFIQAMFEGLSNLNLRDFPRSDVVDALAELNLVDSYYDYLEGL